MKRISLTILLAIVLALTACGGKDQASDVPAPTAAPTADAASTTADASADAGFDDFFSDDTPDLSFARQPGVIDLDLTTMSSTMVYSNVLQMMMTPEAYQGATIRLRGNLTYYRDEETGREYFAAVIQDATACCAQGIEFVWKGEHHWPQDYPPEDTEVTVTGVFDLYEENDNLYIQLLDADVTWEGQAA